MQGSKQSGSGIGLGAIAIALLLIVGPFVMPVSISKTSQSILLLFGLVFLLTGAVVVTITRLYHKTSADEAFVKTGMGGRKAIINAGALVIPVVHQIVFVSLRTMKLVVNRSGEDALITGDNLRANIEVQFFIKVMPEEQAVVNAAMTLGHQATDSRQVEELMKDKLISALRTVASQKELAELHANRQEFASVVRDLVAKDLEPNGLTLECVTISKLDQTPPQALRPDDNVFDAQGAKRIAEITNKAKVERNEIERAADQQVKRQDVERDKFVYEKDVEKASAEAARDSEIKAAQSKAAQEAQSIAAEQERLVGIAEVSRDQAIQIAEVEKARALEVANQQREQAGQTAEVAKQKAIELAFREKEIAIADAERKRAEANTQRLAAEAKVETERQGVKSVEILAAAERDKGKAILDAQATIEQDRLRQEMTANVEAYKRTKAAEAEREAAENQAVARLALAKADKEAKLQEAEGDRAYQMVPVDVERERVQVKKADLEIQSANQEISKELQLKLAEIEAGKAVEIARADAASRIFTNAKLTLWGTPEQASRMTEMLLKGQGLSSLLDGLVSGTGGNGDNAMAHTAEVIAGIVEKLTGVHVDPKTLGNALKPVEIGEKK